MSQAAEWRRVLAALAGCALLFSVACQTPGSQRIVGPDGSPMAHVHCGAEQGVCFRLAGDLCPGGYELKPVLSGSDGNFLVRCRAPAAAVVAAVCPAPEPATPTRRSVPAPPAGASARPVARDDHWPPSAEPSPAAYPWPPAQTSAAARSQPSAPAAQGEVDLGY